MGRPITSFTNDTATVGRSGEIGFLSGGELNPSVSSGLTPNYSESRSESEAEGGGLRETRFM